MPSMSGVSCVGDVSMTRLLKYGRFRGKTYSLVESIAQSLNLIFLLPYQFFHAYIIVVAARLALSPGVSLGVDVEILKRVKN